MSGYSLSSLHMCNSAVVASIAFERNASFIYILFFAALHWNKKVFYFYPMIWRTGPKYMHAWYVRTHTWKTLDNPFVKIEMVKWCSKKRLYIFHKCNYTLHYQIHIIYKHILNQLLCIYAHNNACTFSELMYRKICSELQAKLSTVANANQTQRRSSCTTCLLFPRAGVL